jgi:GntR family transcriptional repressor for pyruvate dehydrogenase complex
LRPADRIPSERELSKAFNVSRVTFREAIKLLEREGLLETFPGNGTFVTDQGIGSNSAFLFQEISRNKFRPPEIHRLRQMIEPQIANMAAMRATAKDISELSAIYENQEQGGEPEKQDSLFVNFDHDFHKKIGEIAGNSLLLQILDWAIGALQESRLLAVSNAESNDLLCEGHKDILNAIRSGDGPLAEKAMREHLEDVENWISTD